PAPPRSPLFPYTTLFRSREQRSGKPEPKPELTLIIRATNVQADGEVHRQIGLNSAMSLDELHNVLNIVFGVGGEQSPWRFEDQLDRKSTRLNSSHVSISY